MPRQQQAASGPQPQHQQPVAPPPIAPPPIPQYTTLSARTRRSRVNPLVQQVVTARAPGKSVRDTITAANGALAAGALEHSLGMPWAGGAALGVVMAAAGAVMGYQKDATAFGLGTGAAAGGWLAWSAADTPFSIPSLVGLLGASVIGGVAYARTRRRLRKIRELDQKIAEANAQRIASGNTAEVKAGWQEVLEKAGCKGVVIDRIDPLTDGAEGVRLTGRFTDPRSYRYETLAADLGIIEATAAGMTPYDIRNGSMNIYRPKGGQANGFELTIPTKNILGQTIWHPIDHNPRSVEDPIEFATSADGRRISVRHSDVAHGMFSGATDFGKSNLLNTFLFEWTRSVDATVCLIAGPTKAARTLKPLLAPWLRGEVPNPPVDRIAPTWETAMRALWDAKCAIQRRSKGKGIEDTGDKWDVTADAPRILIPIEEAGELLQNNKAWKAPDGSRWTFSDLLVDVISRARSEAINILVMTQGGTADLAGDRGPSLKKQIVFRVAFRAQATTERDAVLATDTRSVELSSLGKGEVFCETSSTDARPTMALCDYMGGGKGEEDLRVLIGREHYRYAQAVDDWTAEAMPYYETRWTNSDVQRFLAELVGKPFDPAAAADPAAGADSDTGDDDQVEVDDAATAAAVDRILAAAEQAMEEDQRQVEVEQLRAAWEASPDARTVGDLESETLRLLRIFQEAPGGSAVPMDDLTAAAARILDIDANTEAARRVTAALRDIMGMSADQLEKEKVKRRGTVDGRKLTVVDVDRVREQLRRLSAG